MMTLKIKIIILLVLIWGFIYIVNLIRKRRLELQYSISWMLLDVLLFVIVLIPGILEWLSGLLGIYDVSNMVFFLGLTFAIILIFNLTRTVSKASDQIRQLTQRLAIAEYDEKKMKEDTNE